MARLGAWFQRSREVIFGVGSLLLVLVCLVLVAGQVLTPLRLYATASATPTSTVIVSCKRQLLFSSKGVSGFVYEARTEARSGYLKIHECISERDEGKSVTVIYNEPAELGVVLSGNPTLWNITLAVHSGTTAVTMLIISVGVLLVTGLRVFHLAVFYVEQTGQLLRKVDTTSEGDRNVLVHRTRTLSGFLALTLLHVALIALIGSFWRALLYLPTPHVFLFGLASLGLLVCIWSPLPTISLKFAWNFYRSTIFAAVANAIVALALARGIWGVVRTFWTNEPEGIDTPRQILMAVLKAFFWLG